MSSEYDNIKTAKELVSHVMFHGFSTKTEDVCRAQDIFGHSTIEELAFLANDIGRDDKDGNPDPNGTMYSGRKATRDTFYQIAFHIWSWEQAVRFWNEHTNPEHEDLITFRDAFRAANERLESLEKRMNELVKQLEDSAQLVAKNYGKYLEQVKCTKEAEDEIIRLKAKLYDLTVGKEE